MNKIKNFFIKFTNGEIVGIDKFLHFSFSYIIASGFNNPFISIIMVLILNLLKEWFDKKIKQSKFDLTDTLAGVLGGISYLLMEYIKNI